LAVSAHRMNSIMMSRSMSREIVQILVEISPAIAGAR